MQLPLTHCMPCVSPSRSWRSHCRKKPWLQCWLVHHLDSSGAPHPSAPCLSLNVRNRNNTGKGLLFGSALGARVRRALFNCMRPAFVVILNTRGNHDSKNSVVQSPYTPASRRLECLNVCYSSRSCPASQCCRWPAFPAPQSLALVFNC